MTWGKDETDQKIARAAKETGVPVPETVRDKPVVSEANRLYWECFNDLAGTRALLPGGCGWIPWPAIDAWATRYRITDLDDFEDLKSLVMSLDVVWVEHFTKKPKEG